MVGRYDDFLGQQKKRRDLFEAMMAQSLQPKPVRNVWEGLGNLGATLTYAYMADKKGQQVKDEEDAGRKRYASLVGSLLGASGQPAAPSPAMTPTAPASPMMPPTTDPLNAPSGMPTLPAASQGAPAPGAPSPSPGAPAQAAQPLTADRVMELLNDPATFDLGQQLAMNMLQGVGPQLETLQLSDGSIVQRNPQTNEMTVVIKGGILSPEQMQQELQLRSAGRSVQNTTIQNMGNIPPGWQVFQDPKTGAVRMEPVPGGPVDLEQQAAEAKASKTAGTKAITNDVVSQDVDRAIKMLDEQGMIGVTGLGAWTNFIPGTGASDFKNLLDTLQANTSFDKLQAMREASPTGGALGSVSERELALLQSTLGSLSQSQSAEQLKANLLRFKQVYQEIVNGPPGAAPQGSAPAQSGTPAPPPGFNLVQ